MERNEENHLPVGPARDDLLPSPAREEENRQASDEVPPWAISPPPMPWPRVFPGL